MILDKNYFNNIVLLSTSFLLTFTVLNFAENVQKISSKDTIIVDEENGALVEDDFNMEKETNTGIKVVNCIGIKSGFSVFNGQFVLSPDHDPIEIDLDYRLGPFTAIVIELLKMKIISHYLQFHYYQSGGLLESDEYDSLGNFIETVHLDYRFDYIGIGYAISFFPPLKKFIPYITFGPHFDFLIDNKAKIKEKDQEFEMFKYKELNKFNFGLLLSSGIEYIIKNIIIFSEYSYVYNGTPFFDTEQTVSNLGTRHITNGHFICIGFKYLFNEIR